MLFLFQLVEIFYIAVLDLPHFLLSTIQFGNSFDANIKSTCLKKWENILWVISWCISIGRVLMKWAKFTINVRIRVDFENRPTRERINRSIPTAIVGKKRPPRTRRSVFTNCASSLSSSSSSDWLIFRLDSRLDRLKYFATKAFRKTLTFYCSIFSVFNSVSLTEKVY